MKKVLLFFSILCTVLLFSACAQAEDMSKYVGKYYRPTEIYRNHFGETLTVHSVTDEYIDFKYEYDRIGGDVIYTTERAYFVDEYTAIGQGTVAPADMPDDKEYFDFIITLNYDCINVSTSENDKGSNFYLTEKGKFTESKQENNGDFSLIINDYYIVVSNDALYVSDLREMYQTTKISENASWRFLSDGYFLYYVENGANVHRVNLQTLDDEYLFSDEDAFLIDCYKPYILYEHYSEGDPIESVLAVYNASKEEKHHIDNYSSGVGLYSNRVVYMEQRGEYMPVDLTVSDVDRKNKKIITSLALECWQEGEYIYYAEALEDTMFEPDFVIKRCDIYGNNIVTLTDVIKNKYVQTVTPEYVEMYDGNGMYTDRVYYKTKTVNDIKVLLNGIEIEFDQPPIIKDDRTLVPMRAIFEAMGCEVEWYDGTIDVWKNDENIMTLWIDDPEMWLPDRTVILDVPPQIVNDRTLVPVRAISESMGARVEWDGDSRTVKIFMNSIYSDNAGEIGTE